MRAVRIIIGLPLAFLALGYMVIGSMFMTGGPPYNTGAGQVLAITGLLGFCAPVVLFGLHLAFSGPEAPRRLRSSLFLALIVTAAIGVGGSLFALGQSALQADAASMLGTVLISTLLFGWVIVGARFFGRGGEDRPNRRPAPAAPAPSAPAPRRSASRPRGSGGCRPPA